METNSRTVTPNGVKIQQLRQAKGLNVADMSVRAGFSQKTLAKIEEGHPCFVFTLASAAKALGVEAKDLIQGAEPPPMGKVSRIILTRRGDYADTDETEMVAFAEALGKLIGAQYAIEVEKVEPGGSILITLKLHPDDAERLRRAGFRGLLDQLGVTDGKDVFDQEREEVVIDPEMPTGDESRLPRSKNDEELDEE